MESGAHQATGGTETCISVDQGRSFNQTTENDEFSAYGPLIIAAMDGEWESAENFLISQPDSGKVPITTCGRTALHIAAGAGHSKFVLKMVAIMPREALEFQDSYDGNTALHLAVIAGLEESVKAMVQKNRDLTQICNKKKLNPLLNAAIHINVDHTEIIKFLCGVMKDEYPSIFTGHLGAHLICSITRAGLYELAYNLIHEHPSLATAVESDGNTMLDVLAEKGPISRDPHPCYGALSFQSDTQQYKFIDKTPKGLKAMLFFNPVGRADHSEILRTNTIVPELVKIIFQEISCMTKKDMRHFFFDLNFPKTAAKTGSIDILKRCISTYPDQLWFPHEGRNIFQIAVENRQEKTFDYLYNHMNADEKILTTRIVDSDGGNILHVAAKLAPSLGMNNSPFLRMQNEIRWFKKLEKKVPPAFAKMRNIQGDTPMEVFTREHKELLKNAEAYMFRTAESCLIVAALVATVAFAAAFTVPGGNCWKFCAKNRG